jgi:hypothetical protein
MQQRAQNVSPIGRTVLLSSRHAGAGSRASSIRRTLALLRVRKVYRRQQRVEAGCVHEEELMDVVETQAPCALMLELPLQREPHLARLHRVPVHILDATVRLPAQPRRVPVLNVVSARVGNIEDAEPDASA